MFIVVRLHEVHPAQGTGAESAPIRGSFSRAELLSLDLCLPLVKMDQLICPQISASQLWICCIQRLSQSSWTSSSLNTGLQESTHPNDVQPLLLRFRPGGAAPQKDRKLSTSVSSHRRSSSEFDLTVQVLRLNLWIASPGGPRTSHTPSHFTHT